MNATLKRRLAALEKSRAERRRAISDKMCTALSDDELDALVVLWALEAGSIAPDLLPTLYRVASDPAALHANCKSAYRTGHSALGPGEAQVIGWPTTWAEMEPDFDKDDVGGTWAVMVAEAVKALDVGAAQGGV